MEYTAARPPIMDHVVTLESIQKYFVNYMINDSPGAISTAHLIHAYRHPMKLRSPECLQLAASPSQELQLKCSGHCDQGSTQILWNGGTNQCIFPMELSARSTEQLRVVCRDLLLSCPCSTEPRIRSGRGGPWLRGIPGICYNLYAEKLATLISYYSVEHEDEKQEVLRDEGPHHRFCRGPA
ncbi:hypothetical protein VPH35_015590 [Triticum aestivum]|uniref:RNA-dependent RNA polymerase n=1 Tax=Aegilops tauschii subsp. strangulata TaxID=200361 RepID=A0A452Z885_AEGTS